MRYDETTVEQARNTDMLTFFSRYMGFTFKVKGTEYRCREHPSLSVKNDRLTWYWHSRSVGGRGALDFLIKVEGMDFREAMAKLAGEPLPSIQPTTTPRLARSLILPEKAGFLYKRLFAYLNQSRGIDGNIITALIQEKKLYEDKRGNVVFVGYDENNTPRFASLRGTYTDKPFRMDCAGSDKQYGFKMNYSQNGRLYIFESPIDCMSHATLENMQTGVKNAWRGDNRLSLGGTSGVALHKYLELHGNTAELIFCLDNDNAGNEAAAILAREYGRSGFIMRIEPPQGKDYNEDLQKYKNERLIINENKTHKCAEYR